MEIVFRGGRQPTTGTVRVVYVKPSTHSGGDLAGVFRSYRGELVRLAAFILGDRGAGEDVVQDVFVRVYQRGYPVDGHRCPTCVRRWSIAAGPRCGGG